jgi:hypothetical protein
MVTNVTSAMQEARERRKGAEDQAGEVDGVVGLKAKAARGCGRLFACTSDESMCMLPSDESVGLSARRGMRIFGSVL